MRVLSADAGRDVTEECVAVDADHVVAMLLR
jgi:hypothetical protein